MISTNKISDIGQFFLFSGGRGGGIELSTLIYEEVLSFHMIYIINNKYWIIFHVL